ncbi:uncharacterized protein LOC124545880 [Schistocerca americana]|uniref:uncharacterized protein LOC124545880 n=1 Tax=Schistocerca americana TaxID=7009 RepID=UPI001F4F5A5D|nr:uncharacterized protein LOC124545880 [Schistocerca americana]
MKTIDWAIYSYLESRGLTQFDHATNIEAQQQCGVTPISDKLGERRLRWYGHIMHSKVDLMARTAMHMDKMAPDLVACPKCDGWTVSSRIWNSLMPSMKMPLTDPNNNQTLLAWYKHYEEEEEEED